jgi:hypothetical protein
MEAGRGRQANLAPAAVEDAMTLEEMREKVGNGNPREVVEWPTMDGELIRWKKRSLTSPFTLISKEAGDDFMVFTVGETVNTYWADTEGTLVRSTQEVVNPTRYRRAEPDEEPTLVFSYSDSMTPLRLVLLP